MSNIKNYNENLTDKELEKIIKRTNRTEEQKEIKKFLIILFFVIVIVLGFYFFTKDVVKKETSNKKAQVTFNYDKTIMGALFNRPYDEYYALIFNSEDVKANYYGSLFSSYKSKEGAIKIYMVDLSDSMNDKFYNKKKSNPNAKTLDDLKVSDLTLLKIKDKKITKFIETEDEIKSELGL